MRALTAVAVLAVAIPCQSTKALAQSGDLAGYYNCVIAKQTFTEPIKGSGIGEERKSSGPRAKGPKMRSDRSAIQIRAISGSSDTHMVTFSDNAEMPKVKMVGSLPGYVAAKGTLSVFEMDKNGNFGSSLSLKDGFLDIAGKCTKAAE